MANIIKKALVLGFLLVIVFAVYLVKSKDARENVLLRLGLAASKDFKIPQDIKINASDINMEKLGASQLPEKPETEETEETAVTSEEGTGASSIEAWQEPETVTVEKPVSLSEIETQVREISQQVEKIQKQTDILVAINGIQKEIKQLSQEAKEMNLECSGCNILSSI